MIYDIIYIYDMLLVPTISTTCYGDVTDTILLYFDL